MVDVGAGLCYSSGVQGRCVLSGWQRLQIRPVCQQPGAPTSRPVFGQSSWTLQVTLNLHAEEVIAYSQRFPASTSLNTPKEPRPACPGRIPHPRRESALFAGFLPCT